MEETPAGGDTTETDQTSTMLSTGPMSNPSVRRGVFWLLQVRTAADALPTIFQAVATSGKLSIIGLIGFYIFFVALWLPFWIFSFVVSEWGIYTLAFLFTFMVGRAIIRLIAFPGSSARVSTEIESEFAKYSVRMLVSSCNSLIDVASAILQTSQSANQSTNPGSGGIDGVNASFSYYEIPGLWKRAKSYRNRVLGVYLDVLLFLLRPEEEHGPNASSDTTRFGNNRLKGDIGNLSSITPEAVTDGRELLDLLMKTLAEVDRLEEQARPILESSMGSGKPQPISSSARMTANSLVIIASELRDFVSSLKPASAAENQENGADDEEESLTVDAVRRRFEEQNGSTLDTVKAGAASILPMLDPPLHTSIFGFDVLRGCMLSRYRGARQLWIQRPSGGMIDVLHIPSKKAVSESTQNSKAVMYCNPNAGLIEVATGMSLAGGNVSTDVDDVVNDNCWADFYTNLGFDVYLFNYAGFGRSYGTTFFGGAKRGGDEPFLPGMSGRIRRICHSTFLSFRPTPDTLRADGLAVANHIVSQLDVNALVIHGESIGGVAASGAARKLTESAFLKDKVSLLICDRTFCNLEAVAQRLVGSWTGYAIRTLAPFWSTDVAGDFLAANCPKVVANDCADAIISDASSLKSGISFWKEIRRGVDSTKDIGWILETPVEYRMADWENVCVNDSRYVKSSFSCTRPPIWPADKHISLDEGFHFAACAKRIGKIASLEKKRLAAFIRLGDTEAGIEIDCQAPIFLMWKMLGCCDGLCGSALGVAVRGGFDCTVAWLCSALTFGGQTVVEAAEHRLSQSPDGAAQSLSQLGPIVSSDFDCRPPGYEKLESDVVVHPKPIPEVLASLRQLLEANSNDEMIKSVNHELTFVIGTLEYVEARLSSPPIVESSWKNRHLYKDDAMMVGSFLNLHCGHNNPFSAAERKRLKTLLLHAASMSAANSNGIT